MISLFMGKIYASLQGFFGIANIIASIIVMIGVQCDNILQYIVGAFVIMGAVMTISGAWGSRLLAKTIGELRVENTRYSENNAHHESLNRQHEEENKKLQDQNAKLRKTANDLQTATASAQESAEKSKQSADALSQQNSMLESNIIMLKSTINATEEELNKLRSEVFELRAVKEELMGENKKLELNVSDLRKNNDKLENSLGELQENIAKHEKQTKKMQKIITIAEANRKRAEQQMENLMASLAETGDDFVNFNEVLSKNVDKTASTAEKMDALLSKLGSAKFAELDKDGDGNITREELMEWVDQQSSDAEDDILSISSSAESFEEY